MRIAAGAGKSLSLHLVMAEPFLSSSIISSKKFCSLPNHELKHLSCHFLTVKLATGSPRALNLTPMYILMNVLSI